MEESSTYAAKEQVEGTVAISVDVEMSYSPSREAFVKSIHCMLRTFEELELRVTCFVQGEATEVYPAILSDIAGAGHEVGSHGYTHRNQQDLTKQELEKDLERSLRGFSDADIICAGYRSPFFLRHGELDEVLLKHGVPYDSSIPRIWFPGRYDHRSVPAAPYRRTSGLVVAPVGRSRSWLPLSVEHFKVLAPLFRAVPRHINPVVYTHSYSFGVDFKRPWYNRNRNLIRTKEALQYFTRDRSSVTIGELVKQTDPILTH